MSTLERVVSLASDVVRHAPPAERASPPARTPSTPGAVAEVPGRRVADVPAPILRQPVDPPAAEATEVPAHVDSGAELVAERADPGAVDGAGATLTIDEPWPGYHQLDAQSVIARISTADDAELAVTQLYEQTHKRRATVLDALHHALESSERARH